MVDHEEWNSEALNRKDTDRKDADREDADRGDVTGKQPNAGRTGLRSPSARSARVARAARPARQTLDGVLLIDKPVGLSSHDALLRAKGILRAKKAGHTGTLDPLASGLLPLCFGEATKFSQDLLDADKYYDATMRLGERTDTGDAEGEIIETRAVVCDLAAVDAAIAAFRGEIEQVPPMYSAIKRDGKPLYEYARAGQVVERESRRVVIHALERLSDAALLRDAQSVQIRVHCSKGTYIRTLAEDIGEHLGCGAHLTALRRTRVGLLTIDGAYTLAALQERLNAMMRSTADDVTPGGTGTASETTRSDVADDRAGYVAAGLSDDTLGDPSEAASGDSSGDSSATSSHVGDVPKDDATAAIPALDPAGLLQPIDSLLSSFPAVTLGADYTRRFLHGQRLRLTEAMTKRQDPSRDASVSASQSATTDEPLTEQIGMQWPAGQSALNPAVAEIGRVRVYSPDQRLLGTATLNGGLLAPERLVGTSAVT